MNVKNKAAQAAVQAQPCPNERHMLALQCTWDIEVMADAVNALADEVGADWEVLLRCYGVRIATLNLLVMSYLNEETGVTAEHMHKAIFGRMKQAEGAQA